MRIRKRTFLEIIFPLMVVWFVCLGVSFIAKAGGSNLRWVFDGLLFLYLLLNKKLLVYINRPWIILLLFYLVWCVSTTLWSEIPILSFSKSTLFAFNVLILLSAGSLWVVKYGYSSSLNWLFLVLVVTLIAGFSGGVAAGSYDSFNGFNAYSGLDWNPNDFGFLTAIVMPYILFKLYQVRQRQLLFLMWFIIFIVDVRFICTTYARSSMAIFLCIISFFVLSLPLSKKILITFSCFISLVLLLVMMPVSYLEKQVALHIMKAGNAVDTPHAEIMLQTRSLVWQKTYLQAMKGGMMGGGFSVDIGDNAFSIKELSGHGYGREKGNAPLAVIEETGFIGITLSALVLISFFGYVVPYYLRMQASDKVAMGLVLGAIVGLIVESLVEAWWDAAAGQELICFWTLMGVAFGMVYLERKPKPTLCNRTC